MNKDWKMKYPKTVKEVNEYLNAPKCQHNSVLYEQEGMMFMLNPFGGGHNKTNELMLSDRWKLEPSMLNHIVIIEHK